MNTISRKNNLSYSNLILQRYGGVHDAFSYGHIDPYLNAKHGYGFSNGYGYNQVDINININIRYIFQLI